MLILCENRKQEKERFKNQTTIANDEQILKNFTKKELNRLPKICCYRS